MMSHPLTRSINAFLTTHPRITGLALASALVVLSAPTNACQVVGMAPGGRGMAPTPLCAGQGGAASQEDRARVARERYEAMKHQQQQAEALDFRKKVDLSEYLERVRVQGRAIDRARSEEKLKKELEQAKKELEDLKKSPEYQAYMKGSWSYLDSRKSAKGGPRQCGATFMKEGMVMMLYGSNDPKEMAMLTLSNLDKESAIPHPSKPVLIKATIKQTGASAVTTNVWNHLAPDEKSGAITFGVPSLKAGVDGLLDTLRMQISVEGKQVFDLEYHGGLQAQAKLRQCLKGA